jgi:folate-binding protein YgfZ
MGEHHGWEMPAVFSSLEKEFDAAIRRAVFMDHSFYGRIEVRGADRVDFLHRLSTNELLKAKGNTVVGTVFTNEKGRIIDYATVALRGDRVLLIVSPGNDAVLLGWLDKYHITEDISFRDVTYETAMISVIGPQGRRSMSSLLRVDLPVNGVVDVEVKRGTVTVACAETSRLPMLHLIGSPSALSELWGLLSALEPSGVIPMGYIGGEAYRIARGVAAIGGELSEAFNPFEVGLREAINFTKGCYIGQEVIARLETYRKVRKKLVGLVFSVPFARRVELPLLLKESEEVGVVTSWLERPLYNKYIGLGVVSSESVDEGDSLQVRLEEKDLRALALNIPILVQGASVA